MDWLVMYLCFNFWFILLSFVEFRNEVTKYVLEES